jgi:hypothetical protein
MILILNITYFKIYGLPDPSINVKVLYPYKNSTFTINDNLQVKGTSKYNPDLNCVVSLIINDKKPYTVVTPTGINGTKDFTKWEFVIDKNDTLFNGTNKITAKNHCLNSDSSVFNSVFFNISSATNIVSNQTSNLNGTNANNTATNDLISKASAQPSATNIVSNSDDLIISKNFIPNLTAASNTLCCQNLVSEGQKLPKVSDGLFKKVSADSSLNNTSSASEPAAQGKNVTQNLSREIQMNLDKLSQDNDDEESGHESHKEDDNQESDTGSKTDLDDLHKLRSFLHKELK